MNEKYVIIKGVKYDATTGLPVGKALAKKAPAIHAVHSIAQKSRDIKNRAITATPTAIKAPIRKIGRNMDIARSKSISHFTKPTQAVAKKPVTKAAPLATKKHPLVARAEKKQQTNKVVAPKLDIAKSPKQIKEASIAAALDKPVVKPKKEGFSIKHIKPRYAIAISVLLLLVAGYFTYINMPALSVRVAGAQAGINAEFPEYHPDGYSPNGPVTYSDGEVTIKFKSNTGNGEFAIKQSKSSWDSSAVKNKVDKDSNGGFITTEEHGLTIYTYSGNAAWVNGGILYSITGNAPLSNEQIIRMATSL